MDNFYSSIFWDFVGKNIPIFMPLHVGRESLRRTICANGSRNLSYFGDISMIHSFLIVSNFEINCRRP